MPENLEKEVEMQGLIGAIIAFIGVVLSVSIPLFISLKTNRYDYNQLFAKTVSESRNKWLNEMRNLISTMLAEVKEPHRQEQTIRTKRSAQISIGKRVMRFF